MSDILNNVSAKHYRMTASVKYSFVCYVNLRHQMLPLNLIFAFYFNYFQSKRFSFLNVLGNLADKTSDKLKMLQEIRSSRTAVFCKNVFLKNFTIFIEKVCDEVSFGKAIRPHVCNCTKKDVFTVVFLRTD